MADGRRKQQKQLVPMNNGARIDSNDIILEILSRLPRNSLRRCRCVCKSWRALISDPDFIRIHAVRGLNNDLKLLMFDMWGNPMSIDYESFSSLLVQAWKY
ncbi:unnamed protein product [Malus baccata var. baccata]